MYLLDTNVVSELRKLKPHRGVVAWVQNVPEEALHLSAVTIGEIEAWLDCVAKTYNVVSADALIFRRWAQLMHHRTDHHLEDALIAATALVRRLSVVTRNVDAFRPFGVRLINPFTRRSAQP